jgi:hypothetical protein
MDRTFSSIDGLPAGTAMDESMTAPPFGANLRP